MLSRQLLFACRGVQRCCGRPISSPSSVATFRKCYVSSNAGADSPSSTTPEPVFAGRNLWRADTLTSFQEKPQAWLSTLEDKHDRKIGLLDLHPDVFRAPPRLDIVHRNIVWQQNYRNVQFTKTLTRAEMPGGGKKPWPGKRMGRSKAGSIRAPYFRGGGIAHGVRGPRTWFYMLPDALRLKGLCTSLTIKHNQDDLVIVDSFDRLPSPDAQLLHDLADHRNWGYSVLFIDVPDRACENLALACADIPSFNIMPTYGLNCYSMHKYQTLVMTHEALNYLEERILFHLHRADTLQNKFRYKDMKEKLLNEGEGEDDPVHAPFV
uniref:Large ribosomal subunit protein uL4m n=1 Tax=Plectus sambesii TaxID=2011161 RepID=A0A914WZ06_9BILA